MCRAVHERTARDVFLAAVGFHDSRRQRRVAPALLVLRGRNDIARPDIGLTPLAMPAARMLTRLDAVRIKIVEAVADAGLMPLQPRAPSTLVLCAAEFGFVSVEPVGGEDGPGRFEEAVP